MSMLTKPEAGYSFAGSLFQLSIWSVATRDHFFSFFLVWFHSYSLTMLQLAYLKARHRPEICPEKVTPVSWVRKRTLTIQ
jgi:hypothetical protein